MQASALARGHHLTMLQMRAPRMHAVSKKKKLRSFALGKCKIERAQNKKRNLQLIKLARELGRCDILRRGRLARPE